MQISGTLRSACIESIRLSPPEFINQDQGVNVPTHYNCLSYHIYDFCGIISHLFTGGREFELSMLMRWNDLTGKCVRRTHLKFTRCEFEMDSFE